MQLYFSEAKGIEAVYNIAHLDNVQGILRDGVWSRNKALTRNPLPKIISDGAVIQRRGRKFTDDGKILWDYANFYFQPYNPMLVKVWKKYKQPVVIIRFKRDIMNIPGAYISVGNAAANASELYSDIAQGERELLKYSQELNYQYSFNKDVTRIKMSELLVPDCVPPSGIDFIYTPNNEITAAVKEMSGEIPVEFDDEFAFI